MVSCVLILASIASLVWTASANSNPFDIAYQSMRCPADAEEDWTYRGSNGPNNWGEKYPKCNGANQSPIAVNSRNVVEDENLEKVQFYFYDVPISNMTITNDGKSISISPNYPLGRLINVNGTFFGLYEIHFHWGATRRRGSEHIIDGVQYAMEMHLVHWNYNNQFAVVAVFFEQDSGINAELQHIVNELPKLTYKGNSVVSRWLLNLFNFLPENPASYYMYDGSLTTPDCSEGVTWVLLKEPQLIGNTQIREFRKLSSATQEEASAGCTLSGNFRPIQHLHGRPVYSSQ